MPKKAKDPTSGQDVAQDQDDELARLIYRPKKGPGRPRKPEGDVRDAKNISLPRATWRVVDALAEERGVTRVEIVEAALAAYLRRHVKK